MSVSKFDAIHSLVGGQLAGDPDGKKINYIDGQKPPSEKEIEDEIARLEKEESDNEYKDKREVAYPQLGEQLDLLFHDMTSGKGDKTGEWYKAIAKVKSDNPKE